MTPQEGDGKVRRRIRSAAARRKRLMDQLEEATRELVDAFDAGREAGVPAKEAAALAGMTKQNLYLLRRRAKQ